MTDHAPTTALLDRFVNDITPLVPLTSVWAHGSLAGGDYRPGRSDLDLIAVLDRHCLPEEERRLAQAHERLGQDVPLAAKLHCSYAAVAELPDSARSHLTWAHEELMHRPITPVTRRELHDFGLVLYGAPPAAVLPPLADGELAAFVVRDMKEFWRPSLEPRERWLRDIWVDAGMLVLARATVTLRDGRLITKGEALTVLREMRAPAEVVDDIERRRYGSPAPATEQWLALRAELTLAFLTAGIDGLVAAHSAASPSESAP
ncbi:nucleotidyltransferase domain-containing protein [Streptosporangium sp. NPDC051023]|uniref:nucleotidyltransferase domain-containing protein n=1 Tax=Streptosporangium sp. NPDC051023 TaxID=3155410 RepID=UPI00344D17F6